MPTTSCLFCQQSFSRFGKRSYCSDTCKAGADRAAQIRKRQLRQFEAFCTAQRHRIGSGFGHSLKRVKKAQRPGELSDTLALTVRGRV